jgi:hypothetical protein
MSIGLWIRENRIFSIAAFVSVTVLLFQITYWVMSQDLNNVSAGAGAAITGIYGSIAATYKFVLEFAKGGIHDTKD